MKFRQQYNEEHAAEARQLARTSFEGEETLTQRHLAEECDINVLVQRFGLSDAIVPPAAMDPRFYGDLGEIPDLRTAMDRVRDAENKFMALPPELRERFGNSPARLWEFVNDPRNDEESIRLGLLARRTPDPGADGKKEPDGGSGAS